MRIHNVTQGTELASAARTARAFWPRLVGLLGHSSLQPGEALVLEPSSSVHTFFMRFTIDVRLPRPFEPGSEGGLRAAALPDKRGAPRRPIRHRASERHHRHYALCCGRRAGIRGLRNPTEFSRLRKL